MMVLLLEVSALILHRYHRSDVRRVLAWIGLSWFVLSALLLSYGRL